MSEPGEVTVVIPVWDDYVEYLPNAVESVRRNSATAQVIVVDNASDAPLPELPECEVVKSDRRLTAGAARNLGLDRVETDYVLFLDADDMLLDGTLEFLRSRISANPDLSISATAILDGGTGDRHRSPRRQVGRLAGMPRLFAFVDSIWSLLPLQGCAVMRTDQVRASGGYADTNLGEDWVLASALAFHGRVELSDRLGRYYRPTPGGLLGRGHSDRDFAVSARRVRERLRGDQAVPGWMRWLLPIVAVLQWSAIYLVRPAYRSLRGLRRALTPGRSQA